MAVFTRCCQEASLRAFGCCSRFIKKIVGDTLSSIKIDLGYIHNEATIKNVRHIAQGLDRDKFPYFAGIIRSFDPLLAVQLGGS
jgi:hypothetical protein